jgi:hypothetical protein
MNINPASVASARTARLVREASTPVYSTSTPAPKAREHLHAVEIEFDTGGRLWTSMPEGEVDGYIADLPESIGLSDVDHSAKCWCQ